VSCMYAASELTVCMTHVSCMYGTGELQVCRR
jgi:hypothetical protein